MQGQAAFDFFNTLQSGNQPQTKEEDDDSQAEKVNYDMVKRNFNWDLGR